MALLAGASFFAGAADAANLVTNGSFEPDGTGWTGTGTIYSHPYNGIAGTRIADTGGAQSTAATGNYNFDTLLYGYHDNLAVPIGAMFHGLAGGSQTISQAALTGAIDTATIDAGAGGFCFSAWLSSYTGDGNTPALRIQFFDMDGGTGTLLGTRTLDRGTTTNQVDTAQNLATGSFMNAAEDSRTDPDYWALYEIKATLPAGTRSAVIDIVAGTGHVASGANDWYVDAVVFEVAEQAALLWSGAASSEWSTAVIAPPKNWVDFGSPTAALDYSNATPVVFNNTATNRTVNISAGAVSPANVIFDYTGTYTLTGSSGIAGATGISKLGTGTLTFSNPNTFNGVTDVSDGAVVINHSLALQNSVLAGVFGDSTHSIGTPTAVTLGGLGGDADLALVNGTSQPVALTVGNNNVSASYGGELSGAGSLVKVGTGSQSLGYPSTFSGGTTVTAGPAQAESAGTSASIQVSESTAFGSGPVVFSNTTNASMLRITADQVGLANALTLSAAAGVITEVTVDQNQTGILAGVISGGNATSSLFIDSSVTGASSSLVLTNASNSFVVSKITMWRGNLGITSDGALGDPTNDIEHYTESPNGALRFDADGIVLNNQRTISMPGGANIRPFNTQAFTATIAGPFTGTGNLVKTGTGTLILSSTASTHTGGVEVSDGTLRVDGEIASSTTAVTVGATGILAGDGVIHRPVTVTGTLSPGASVGTLEVESTTITGTYKVEVDGALADGLQVTGDLDLTGATLDVSLLGGGFTGASYVIATYTGNLTGTFANVTSGYAVQYGGGQVKLVEEGSGTAFDNWAASEGVSGFDVDSDGDGIANGIEFVIGGEPAPGAGSNSSSLLPTVSYSSGTAELVFVFRRMPDSAYLNPRAEYSTSLSGTWTAGPAGTVIGTSGGADLVEVRLASSLAVSGKLFCRLTVSQ